MNLHSDILAIFTARDDRQVSNMAVDIGVQERRIVRNPYSSLTTVRLGFDSNHPSAANPADQKICQPIGLV